MSEVSFQPAPIATWNNAIGVWEKKEQVNLLCAHSELFSEVWPTSGQMVTMPDGSVCALPIPVRLTADSASSFLESDDPLLPTTRASEPNRTREDFTPCLSDVIEGRPQLPLKKNKEVVNMPTPTVNDMGRGKTVEAWDEWTSKMKSKHGNGNGHGPSLDIEMLRLLPIPNTMEHLPARTPEKIAESKLRTPGGYANLRESVVNDLMPTPKALDGVKGNLKTSQERRDAGFFVDLPNVANDLAQQLPTPMASDWKGANHSGSGSASSRGIATVVEQINWDKFEPAIRRWEAVMGRPAPAPTLPDGKDGAHRLSPWLTEWMMGLPEGWICSPEIGLTRNEQLKAAGNGVCPQQAMLALEMLLEGVVLE